MRLLTSRDPSLVTMVEVYFSNDAAENTDIEDVNLTSIDYFYKEGKNSNLLSAEEQNSRNGPVAMYFAFPMQEKREE